MHRTQITDTQTLLSIIAKARRLLESHGAAHALAEAVVDLLEVFLDVVEEAQQPVALVLRGAGAAHLLPCPVHLVIVFAVVFVEGAPPALDVLA